jgi:hypothetical protein
MRIRSVTAHAFGPLQGETLTFAEGMTVIVGDNESAKSSWHAAIFAALCGRRRGRGQPRADERRFSERHKPWDGEDWLVTAHISLDDGRDIEIRQDLAGKVDCQATDTVLGRDVSSEVMNDGAPDASRWLGLDRTSFVASACVGQGDILQVCENPDSLQDHLQRAAATAGNAMTAAKAIERLDDCLREEVGRDQANSTKPLRNAKRNVHRATQELEDQRRNHEGYLARLASLEEMRLNASNAVARVRACEAAGAIRQASELKQRVSRAAALTAKFGPTPPPSALDDEDLAEQVTEALTKWDGRPAPPKFPQRSSDLLRSDVASLPMKSDGDVEPHATVLAALEKWKEASSRLALHTDSRPADGPPAPHVSATDDELLDLARTLETCAPSVSPPLVEDESAAAKALDTAQRKKRYLLLLLAGGAVSAVLGVLMLFTIGPAGGAALIVLGILLGVVGAVMYAGASTDEAYKNLANARAELRYAEAQAAQLASRKKAASARCAQLGLPATPSELRAIPAGRARARAHDQELATWQRQLPQWRDSLAAAASELGGALSARGQSPSSCSEGILRAEVDSYLQQCKQRALQEQKAARRSDLLQQIDAAVLTESRAADDDRLRSEAETLIFAVAAHCGVSTNALEDAVQDLRDWMRERARRAAGLDAERGEWFELQKLLDGAQLADLERTRQKAITLAEQLAAGVDPTLLGEFVSASADPELPALRKAASEAETAAAKEEGELRQFALNIGSVSEAEEALSMAEAELQRVETLAETLSLAKQFLDEAQTRVHQDIAPLLIHTVKEWLPVVTEGRYRDVTVDPKTLSVKVRGESKRWRDAQHLSHGTTEQIYLLLRIALADHLTKGHDTCPLLLDDVTVHADASRTHEVLNLLLQLAAHRQIILFTQEEQVATWARENFIQPSHAIRELPQTLTV